ncbi:MAG: hypothetical protein AcusKO_26200 [Acuticoccus sp.]
MMRKQRNFALAFGELIRRAASKFYRRPSRSAYFISMIEPLVDAQFYFARYPHVREAGVSAATHYVREGWREGYDPAPWFSSEGYSQINADVAQGNMPPFVHYVIHGRREGRTIMPTDAVRQHNAEDAAPRAVASSAISQDLRALRAREADNWQAHIGDYTERRLSHLKTDTDRPPQAM